MLDKLLSDADIYNMQVYKINVACSYAVINLQVF